MVPQRPISKSGAPLRKLLNTPDSLTSVTPKNVMHVTSGHSS